MTSMTPEPAALLRMWRNLVNEGGVPRYTITPGAALNTLVTWTDDYLTSQTEGEVTAEGWRPIESAPEGTPILVCSEKDVAEGEYTVETMSVRIKSEDTEHRFFNLNSGNYSRPDWWTHWRPLPAPPMRSASHDRKE